MNSTIVQVTKMDSESAKVALTCNWGSRHKEMSCTNMYIFVLRMVTTFMLITVCMHNYVIIIYLEGGGG